MALIQSLQKGIDILFLFNRERTTLTVDEIARLADIPVPSAYRFVATLKDKGLLEKNDTTGRYSLGLRILELEASVHRKLNLESVSIPLLKKLAKTSNETVQLTIVNKKRGICIFVEESTSPLRIAPEKGRRLALHGGASVQVILAFLPEDDRKKIYKDGLEKFTDQTITDPVRLEERLGHIRRQGYAVTAGELYLGSIGIAAPVFDQNAKVIGSVAVSGPEQRMTADKQKSIRKAVVQVTSEISKALGYRAFKR